MMTLNNIPREAYTASKLPGLPVARMLTSAVPFIALAVPGAAYAQSATNTATITAPTGAIEANTANNSATDTDTVLAVLVATNDSATGEFGVGATDVISVLANDTVNGATATASDVTISVASGSSVPTGLTFDTTDGTVDVAAGTAAGTYTFDYTICETANPTNCEDATVSVVVEASTIIAVADSATGVDGVAGATDVVNVLTGDTIGGVAATTSNVTISVASGSSVPAGLTFDTTDGSVDVAAGTAAGTYTFDYTICDTVNPTNCATETVSITVDAPTVVASPDTATGVDGIAGTTGVVNVFDGDTIGGSPADSTNSTISVASGSSVPTGLTFDTSTGDVDVDPGTPAGTYTFDYTICDALNPTNCQTETVSVTVAAPAIAAIADSATGVDGVAGATDVLNVLTNDTFNGGSATTSNVTIAVASGTSVPTGLTFDTTDGSVDVSAGTPAGTYTFDYTICDVVNPTNCATETVSVTVIAPSINADPDSVSGLNGVTGGTDVLNVLDGDTIGGAPATPSNVDISVVTPATPNAPGDPVPTLDVTTGQIQLPAGTPAGTYEIVYQICDPLNPTNCAQETATVIVAPSVDLSITKTNGVTEVTSGQTVTYTLVVSNAGPDTATGAVLRDTPGAGLTCPATNPLSFSGSGIPSGSFTVADLTGPGITLGALADGESVTVTYSCTVD